MKPKAGVIPLLFSNFLRKAKNILTGFPRSYGELVNSLRLLGDIRQIGWHRTLRRGTVGTSSSDIVPHLPYSLLGFLEFILSTGRLRVLEFGSGASTGWFAERADEVVTIEHSAEWFNRIGSHENVHRFLIPCRGDWYFDDDSYAYSHPDLDGKKFDLILIDGMARVDCARAVDLYLRKGGLVIVDDLHDPLVAPATQFLEQQFSRLDFWGIRPYSGAYGGSAVFVNGRFALG